MPFFSLVYIFVQSPRCVPLTIQIDRSSLMNYETIPQLFKYSTSLYSNSVHFASRGREGGDYVSTAEFFEKVKYLALGLTSLNIKHGDRIGIIAQPSPDWLFADLAIMIAGFVSVPVFKRISPESLQYEIKDAAIEYMFIGLEAELEAVRKYGKGVRKIIPLGADFSGDDILLYNELTRKGREIDRANPEFFEKMILKSAENDVATIIYTSGSTGIPKGVVLTHKNIISQVKGAGSFFPLDAGCDFAFSSLPLAHIFERMVMYYYVSSGVTVYFADDIQKIGERIKEVRPTVMTAVPRLLEKVYAKMTASVEGAGGIKGLLGKKALASLSCKKAGNGFSFKLYDTLVYSKLRDALGGNLRMVISGAAALDPDVCNFFINMGVEVYEGYGMTEASPVIAANRPGFRKVGSVGLPFPGVEVKLSEDGEVLARGDNTMVEYLHDKNSTQKALDSAGFLHTGDLGSFDDDGYLTITGRKKELFKKSTGEYVAPVHIEKLIASLDLIESAVVVADKRKFVTALLFPDLENLNILKKKYDSLNLTDDDFVGSDIFREKVREHIADINRHLHHTEEVVDYRCINSALTIENGDLTPTMKIRRHVIEEKYSDSIEEMYSNRD